MTILRLITTSNYLPEERIFQAISNSEAIGFSTIKVDASKESYFSRWAGTPQQRLKEFENALSENSNAIQTCIGGSGVIHFLEEVNFSGLKKNPKFIIGSSDLTPLLNYSYQKTKIISLHGPNAAKNIDPQSQETLQQALSGENYSIPFSSYKNPTTKKRVKGIIQGGNLAMCSWSLGSKFQINLKNRIVFLEDIGTNFATAYNRVVQLKESNTFKPKAIIFGYLMEVKNINRFIKSIQDLFPNIPIIYNTAIGHQLPNLTVPIGAKTIINFDKKEIQFKIKQVTKSYKVNFDE